MRHIRQYLTVLAAAALALIGAAAAHAEPTITPVMTGLDAPRGLDLTPFGALYVAEAGRGGTGPCVVLRELPQCYGPTGAISRLWHGRQERVVTGLPSTISSAGEITGPHDVAALGLGFGRATIGFGADPARRADFGPAGRGFGQLIGFGLGHWVPLVDVAAVEATSNPAGGPIDSNPYGLNAHGPGALVADAGANALIEARVAGRSRVVATLNSRPTAPNDSVPTEVERGPDGALYVSELTGGPFPEGGASIYRIGRDGSKSVYLSGFKTIIDFAFARDGSVYVLQFATGPFLSGTGALYHVAVDGTLDACDDGARAADVGRGGQRRGAVRLEPRRRARNRRGRPDRPVGTDVAGAADRVRRRPQRRQWLAAVPARHEVVRELFSLRRGENAEVARARGVVRALAGQSDVPRPLARKRRARREVVRVSVPVLRGHGREERPVLRRDVDEVGVRIPERQVFRRPGRLLAVQPRQEGCVVGAELDADRTVRVEPTERLSAK